MSIRSSRIVSRLFPALAFVTALSAGLARPARAGRDTWIPPAQANQKPQLKLRVAGYRGGTNGELTVEVTNPGSAPAELDASGLYFIPEGNANDAPQRLGAVGPFVSSENKERKSRMTIPAGGKATVKLDVYCIDSHRRSPRTGDKFHLASDRMPPELAREIGAKADAAAAKVGGYAAPAAKMSVQSEVWKARDKKWIKLQGEGIQEATK